MPGENAPPGVMSPRQAGALEAKPPVRPPPAAPAGRPRGAGDAAQRGELSPELTEARAKLVRRSAQGTSPRGGDAPPPTAEGGAPPSPFGVVLRSTPRQTPRSTGASSPDLEAAASKSAEEPRVRKPRDDKTKKPPLASKSPPAAQPRSDPAALSGMQAATGNSASESPGHGAENKGGERLQSSPWGGLMRSSRHSEGRVGSLGDGTTQTSSSAASPLLQARVAASPSSMWARESPRIRKDAEQKNDHAMRLMQHPSVRTIETSHLVSQYLANPKSTAPDQGVKAEVVVSDSPWRTDGESSGTKVPTSFLVRAQHNAIQLQTLQKHLENLVKENSIQADLLRKHEETIAEHKAEQLAGVCSNPTSPEGILKTQLESVQNERDLLQRAVEQLEEALRMRNEEVKTLIIRTHELEASMIQMQLSPRLVSPTWEERLMRRASSRGSFSPIPIPRAESAAPEWEDDVAGKWITAMTQTMQAIESSLQDSSNTLRLKLQGEACMSRQIRVLHGRLEESERRNRARSHDAAQMLMQCEVLGQAHISILENELQESRKTIKLGEGIYDLMQTSLEKMKQQLADRSPETDSLVTAMNACAAQAREHRQHVSQGEALGGTLAVLHLSGRALAAAWMCIKERDSKVQILQSQLLRANASKTGDFMSMKGKETEIHRLLALVQEKEDLLKAWMQRYESEIEQMQAGHRAAEAPLRQEIRRLLALVQQKEDLVKVWMHRYEGERKMQAEHNAAASSQPLPQSPAIGVNAEVSSQASRPQSPGRGARALSMLSNVLKIRSASAPPRPTQERMAATRDSGSAHAPDACRPSDEVESMRQLNQQLATMLVERSPPKAHGTHGARMDEQDLNVEGARKAEQAQMQQMMQQMLRAKSDAVKNPPATEPRPTYYISSMSSRGPSPRRARPPRGVE